MELDESDCGYTLRICLRNLGGSKATGFGIAKGFALDEFRSSEGHDGGTRGEEALGFDTVVAGPLVHSSLGSGPEGVAGFVLCQILGLSGQGPGSREERAE